jgi:hypothetical protein
MTDAERAKRYRDRRRRRALLAGKRGKPALTRDKPALRPPRRGNDIEQDLWSTPPCLIAALAKFVLPTMPVAPVWEAAAGFGAIVDALRTGGREVIATDIEPHRSDIAQLDYLTDLPPPSTRGGLVVTNPPFSQLTAFLARTLALLDAGWLSGAALLIRNDFAATDGRADMFNRATAEWECVWRTRWIPGSTGNPRWWCQWVTWQVGRNEPPMHYRLRRRQIEL